MSECDLVFAFTDLHEIISISHDRMYLDEVADVIYELSDNGLNTVL